MPVYESICRKCGKVQEYIRPVSGYLDTPECCGTKSEKIILHPPMGYVENIAYTSPIDGRPITTKQARTEDLRRSGSRPWEGIEQETKVARQRAADEEKQADRKLEQVAAETLAAMPTEKRRVLESSV